jgi:hypothetical protein
MNSGNNNSNPSISQIAINYDLELIKQRAVKFEELLGIVVNSYQNGDINCVRRDLPDLDKFLSEIMERTGKNYCQFTGQNSPNIEHDCTSLKIPKSKRLVRALGFPNGIPQDISDLDAVRLIQTIIAEKMQRVKIKNGCPQLEDKNWTPGVFKILTGFDMTNVNSFANDTNLTDPIVRNIIEKSRLFTEDNRYSFADNCCSQYISAFMPFAKSLEVAFYTLDNKKKKKSDAKKTHSHLSSNNTLHEVVSLMGLKTIPTITTANNSPAIDRSKMSDSNGGNDYYI